MSITSTSTKLAGLVFAMGLFGMGPGTYLVDEIQAKLDSRKRIQEEEDAAIVAPPGEEPSKKGVSQTAHLIDGTTPSSSLPKHPTSKLSQDAAREYVTHPFLPITNVSRTISSGETESTDTTVLQTENSPPKEIPWLSFMMHKPSQATTKQPEIGKL